MRRSDDEGVSMWFWSRQEGAVPPDVRDGWDAVDTDGWGIPEAIFSSSGCNFSSHFDAHQIVFDLTFCGDFAGADYGSCGCPESCRDFTDNHPEAFQEAYWLINSLKTYV